MTQYSSEPDDLVHNLPRLKSTTEYLVKCIEELDSLDNKGDRGFYIDRGQPDMQLSRQGEELANKHTCPNWDEIIGPCGHMKCPHCGPKMMKEAGRLLDGLPIPTEGRQLHPKTDLE